MGINVVWSKITHSGDTNISQRMSMVTLLDAVFVCEERKELITKVTRNRLNTRSLTIQSWHDIISTSGFMNAMTLNTANDVFRLKHHCRVMMRKRVVVTSRFRNYV